MNIDIDLYERGLARLSSGPITGISVWSEDHQLAVEVAQGDKSAMRLVLSPQDMLALGHACIAIAKHEADHSALNAVLDSAP